MSDTDSMSSGGNHKNMSNIMVFTPTMDEFKDFKRYVDYMECCGAHKAGIAKVVSPKEWKPRASGYQDVNVVIPSAIKQCVMGSHGFYQQANTPLPPMNLKDFENLAKLESRKPPKHSSIDDLERKYWKNVTFSQPIYGADISGTLFDDEQNIWNPNRLETILDCICEDYDVKIEGVNTSYLYFGMWKTTFPWHTEDMDLYSLNYLHYGAPKFWYALPPEHGKRLERLAAEVPTQMQLRVVDPFCATSRRSYRLPYCGHNCIPYNKICQEPGDFIITFPYGYHTGFNTGYNCAESTNFATQRWIEYGKRSSQCTCQPGMVRINMDCFVKRYQSDIYDQWKDGLDLAPHPEDEYVRIYGKRARGKLIGQPEYPDPNFVIGGTHRKECVPSTRNPVSNRIPLLKRSKRQGIPSTSVTLDLSTQSNTSFDSNSCSVDAKIESPSCHQVIPSDSFTICVTNTSETEVDLSGVFEQASQTIDEYEISYSAPAPEQYFYALPKQTHDNASFRAVNSTFLGSFKSFIKSASSETNVAPAEVKKAKNRRVTSSKPDAIQCKENSSATSLPKTLERTTCDEGTQERCPFSDESASMLIKSSSLKQPNANVHHSTNSGLANNTKTTSTQFVSNSYHPMSSSLPLQSDDVHETSTPSNSHLLLSFSSRLHSNGVCQISTPTNPFHPLSSSLPMQSDDVPQISTPSNSHLPLSSSSSRLHSTGVYQISTSTNLYHSLSSSLPMQSDDVPQISTPSNSHLPLSSSSSRLHSNGVSQISTPTNLYQPLSSSLPLQSDDVPRITTPVNPYLPLFFSSQLQPGDVRGIINSIVSSRIKR